MKTSPDAPASHQHPDAPPHAHGRDSQGRFVMGNPGGPGNPYYRRQAELKRRLLESVTDADVLSVLRVLLGLARSGDLAAIKLFLEYTVGKPTKEVDPDKVDLHEWQLHQQTPRLGQVGELMSQGIETERANQVARDVVPIVGACHLQTISQHLRAGTDLDGTHLAPPLEETPPAPDRNGGKRNSASARCMTAGVPPAAPLGDNGAGPTFAEMFADVVRAVHSVENGPERALRWWRDRDTDADRQTEPDPR
jgi:hypothetical protein